MSTVCTKQDLHLFLVQLFDAQRLSNRSFPRPWTLSVDFAKNNIQRADDGAYVRQHVVLADVVHGGQVGEPGGLDLAPIGLARSVRHQVDAELAFGCLDGRVGGTSGHREALGEQLEVVDQRLHRSLKRIDGRGQCKCCIYLVYIFFCRSCGGIYEIYTKCNTSTVYDMFRAFLLTRIGAALVLVPHLHLGPGGWYTFCVIRAHVPLRHLIQALLHDPEGLAHLQHPDQVPVIKVYD